MGATKREFTIIGAGVAGLTIAAELIERGAKVMLIEKGDAIGARSCSRYAGGMLAPWCERESAEEPVARLGSEAVGWWESRVPGVIRKGSLVLAKPRDSADLERFARRTGNFEWVDANRLADLEPDLAGRFRKALFFPDEAHLDPREALAALAAYISAKGAKIRLGTEVLSNGRKGGYALPEADQLPGTVIDTRGLAAADTLLQLRGVKGEMLIIRTREISLCRPVRLLHPRIPLYIVPRADGHFMVGATMIESAEQGRITARSMIELLSGAYALHPAFGEAEIIEIGTDVRPAFPDNLPRLVKSGARYFINGLYRHGFLLAPAMARMTAQHLFEDTRAERFLELPVEHHETDRQRTNA